MSLGTNPYALGHVVSDRANRQAQLFQLMAQRNHEAQATHQENQRKFQRDFVLDTLANSGDLGNLFGAGGVARLLNVPGMALGSVVTDPQGFANVRDQVTLDELRSGAVSDLMGAVSEGESAGQMPSISVDMLNRLGIQGLRDVIPQANIREQISADARVAAANASQTPTADLQYFLPDGTRVTTEVPQTSVPTPGTVAQSAGTPTTSPTAPTAPAAPTDPQQAEGVQRMQRYITTNNLTRVGNPLTLENGWIAQVVSDADGNEQTLIVRPGDNRVFTR